MSGYGPFSWSYGLSVIRTIAEPAWYYERQEVKYADLATTDWKPYDEKHHEKPKLPIATYVGWVLLRITLCIDIALINELVGNFVLSAVNYKSAGFKLHDNPYAVAFVGAVGGAISTVLVFLIDIIYSKPEKRERWPMIDPNGTITKEGINTKLAELLEKEWTPEQAKSGDAAQKAKHTLRMQGSKKDAKNTTEGGPITLAKLRTHAVMRLLIWAAVAAVAGAVGTALWLARDGKKVKNMMGQVTTGVVVQLVGIAVIVVGPTILQILSLALEGGEGSFRSRIPREKR